MHLEYSNTRLETPASNGRGGNSVRTLKGVVQRQKDAVFSLGIEFSIKHPLFALFVRHSEWHSVECRERVLPPTVPDTMWPVASTKRLLDTGADDACDDHESKRHKNSDDPVPMAQEPSSGSGVKTF